MDADAAALQRFTDVPYVIEAPASARRMPAAAAAAMAKPRLSVGVDPKGLSPEAYRKVLDGLRGLIGRDLSGNGRYHIDVFDRSAANPHREEMRIDRSLSGYARAMKGDESKEGAFATPYARRDGIGCVIAGFPHDFDVPGYFSDALDGKPANTRGITPEQFHWFTLRHELGHCLLGSSEVKADAFAALMALRDGALTRDQVAVFAAAREALEWTTPDPHDAYFNSPVLWAVVGRADALLADARFRAMSTEDVARLARGMAERHGLSPHEVAEAQRTRQAMQAALYAHQSVEEGGTSHRATLREWMAAHADVPEFARVYKALDNLADGPEPLPRFRYDLAAFRRNVDRLASHGDETAQAMRRVLAQPFHHDKAPEDFAPEIPLARGRAPAWTDGPQEAQASAPGMR